MIGASALQGFGKDWIWKKWLFLLKNVKRNVQERCVLQVIQVQMSVQKPGHGEITNILQADGLSCTRHKTTVIYDMKVSVKSTQ